MEVFRRSSWLLLLLVELQLFFITHKGINAKLDVPEGPSESECRPYIEKALKQLETGDTALPSNDDNDSNEEIPTIEIITDEPDTPVDHEDNEDDESRRNSNESIEQRQEEAEDESNEKDHEREDDDTEKETENDESGEQVQNDQVWTQEPTLDQVLTPEPEQEIIHDDEVLAPETIDAQETDTEFVFLPETYTKEETLLEQEIEEVVEHVVIDNEHIFEDLNKEKDNDIENDIDSNIVTADDTTSGENDVFIKEQVENMENDHEVVDDNFSKEADSLKESEEEDTKQSLPESAEDNEEIPVTDSEAQRSKSGLLAEEDEQNDQQSEEKHEEDSKAATSDEGKENDGDNKNTYEKADAKKIFILEDTKLLFNKEADYNVNEPDGTEIYEATPVEELTEGSEEDTLERRPRDHVDQLLKLDEEASSNSKLISRVSEIVLKDLKKLYDVAIKPLEILYKYRDLSNRHFGDSEIFSKPLILFMGPWSGGKSSIINYLLGIEYSEHALHTGAEPSPAYFNILTHGEEYEILDGTQLAADYTFSGLQKFGQGLEERLRGYKLPSKLLEKVNIVEIPGILEVRKQVSRVFPFNDACQWFIDRADIIFLVYDPSKLDVGPESEAILDQLKGREHQTRIVLNKADQVKPEELMRVQGALIWNISPLMSSAQPPVMYTTSLWSRPYEVWAPVRLLQAQERAFLRDIRTAVDKRIDNKIASARRFAVRVRNHAKMVDCYLTTYYNHKSVFGNRKQISDEIINHPQDFHIYEGLSTLTNISRYDLPDPEVYREFFRLNALYDFQQLSATCTYFRGCPINRLDIAIAYDLPELVGKQKKLIEATMNEINKESVPKH